MFGLKEYGCTSKVDNRVVVRRGSTVSDPLYLTFFTFFFEWNIKTDPHDKNTLPSLIFFIFIFVADDNI